MSTAWQDDFNDLGKRRPYRWDMYGLTNATAEEHEAYAAQKGDVPLPDLRSNRAEIVVRANPGLVLIQNGVVVEKWAGRDVPSPEELTDAERSVIMQRVLRQLEVGALRRRDIGVPDFRWSRIRRAPLQAKTSAPKPLRPSVRHTA